MFWGGGWKTENPKLREKWRTQEAELRKRTGDPGALRWQCYPQLTMMKCSFPALISKRSDLWFLGTTDMTVKDSMQ